MEDSRYNTLLIIEGESCEKGYFTKLINLMKNDKNILIVPFCNDIYELYKLIIELGDTTTKDVILKCLPLDDKTRQKLKTTKFVYTYLVFDLELQNDPEGKQQENIEKVNQMLILFNNETSEYGKLFVNYPMMESYRHFDMNNIDSLKNKQVEAKNEILVKYKRTVGQEGNNKNINQYTLNDFCTVAKAHLMQANLLLTHNYKKPSESEYEKLSNILNLHQKQKKLILENNYMLVLNTSAFIYTEFYPQMLKSRN